MAKVKLKRHYHYDTDNISFIKMYKTLKDMGIKNNKFFLLIYDEGIKNLDPFDEDNLTTDQKVRIKQECRRNLWYFLRQIVKIPVPGGDTRYEIHRGNLALTYCLYKNIDTLIELPRQNYKTQSILCLMEWIYDFNTKNSEINFLHKKYEDSKLNLDRLKKIRALLPSYLLPPVGKDDVNNLASIKNSRGNNIVAKNAAISEEQADLLGRGNTTPITLWDEIAFIKFLKTIYTAAAPAQSQASLEAENNHKPHFKAMLTTPGDVLTPHGKYCKEEFIDKAAPFDEHIYDWSDEKIKNYLEKNSENDIIYIEFSYKQLGRDEKWFKKQCRALNNDISKINREILLKWNRSTDLSPFPPEQIDRLREYVSIPLNTIVVSESYLMTIYENFDWNKKLLIGGDFGGSATKDATVFSVVDPDNMHVVADFRNNKIDPVEAADIVYEMMMKFFPNSIFIPEQNGYSEGCLSILLRTEVSTRIYWEYKDKITEQKLEDGSIKKEKIKTKVYGVQTTGASRPLMIDIVFDIVENGYKDVMSPNVIEDIAGLERKKNGKIEHSSGGHDDSLFSYLMVRYVFAYGNNLGRFNIYKKMSNNAESVANRGARSDEEYVKNFSRVLSANKKNIYNPNQSNIQQQLIDDFYSKEERKYEIKEQISFENETEKSNSSRMASIFALNRRR